MAEKRLDPDRGLAEKELKGFSKPVPVYRVAKAVDRDNVETEHPKPQV